RRERLGHVALAPLVAREHVAHLGRVAGGPDVDHAEERRAGARLDHPREARAGGPPGDAVAKEGLRLADGAARRPEEEARTLRILRVAREARLGVVEPWRTEDEPRRLDPLREPHAFQVICWISVYSSMPQRPPSRPMPLSLKPPKGASRKF